jgi:hypothetical protein
MSAPGTLLTTYHSHSERVASRGHPMAAALPLTTRIGKCMFGPLPDLLTSQLCGIGTFMDCE